MRGGCSTNRCGRPSDRFQLAEAQERLEEVVVAVVERRVDLAFPGLVSDAVLEEKVSDLPALRKVFRRREREEQAFI